MDNDILQEKTCQQECDNESVDGIKQNVSNWVYNSTSEIICEFCGRRQAHYYANWDSVPKFEQNFCHYCGSKMTYKLEE